MFKKLIAASLISLSLIGAATASSISEIKDATNRLLLNSSFICSTNLISLQPEKGGQIVLSANHCVDELKGHYELSVVKEKDNMSVSETRYSLEVQKRLRKSELSVLQVVDEEVKLPSVDLASKEELASVKFGDPVIVAGYPGTIFRDMKTLFLTDGRFLDYTEDFVTDTDDLFISTTAHVGAGMSGGGVYAQFGDEWKLIGITSQRDPTAEAPESVFIPVTRIHEALENFLEPPVESGYQLYYPMQ